MPSPIKLPYEWKLQAALVSRLKKLPEFGIRFTLAGDQNAGRRSFQAAGISKAAGMMAGVFDLRLYLDRARLGLIEMKRGKAKLSDPQIERHALLRSLGYDRIVTLQCFTEKEAADMGEEVLRGWL